MLDSLPRPEKTTHYLPFLKTSSKTRHVRLSFGENVVDYFDEIAREYPIWRKKMDYYIEYTRAFLTKVVPPEKKVLLMGCLAPDILEALRPSLGVGLDVSPRLVRRAEEHYRVKNVSYVCCLPELYRTQEKFDYILLVNNVDYCDDLSVLMDSLQRITHEDSKIIISMLNPLWHSFIRIASRLRIRIPDGERNLVAAKALENLLEMRKFKVNEICRRILIPKKIPLISWLFNQFIARLPVLNQFCFIQYVIATPAVRAQKVQSCSVIVPCFNEEGNIAECIKRIPKMGSFTEILLVNDGSKDQTLPLARKLQSQYRNLTVISYEKNKGKGRAVLEGLRRARGEIVMILDADMTVPPEELVDFYEAINSGAAEFVSGTRFLYPMEKKAMRLANFIGNGLFSKLIAVISGSECSDTLCGTKAFRKKDFEHFQLEDPKWGDFDLIFHAARLKLKCIQIPVHYRSRIHGVSKMRALSAGLSFLKLCLRKWAVLP